MGELDLLMHLRRRRPQSPAGWWVALGAMLVLCVAVGFAVGWSSHRQPGPSTFHGTVTRVSLDRYSVCVRPTEGGAQVCDPLYARAGSKPPVVGEHDWFTYAYDVRGDFTYTLLVRTRPPG